MDAKYRFLVASKKEDGHKHFLSFSDGSVEKWNPRSKVYVYWADLPRYDNKWEPGSITDAARVLESLTRRLEAAPYGRWVASDLLESLVGHWGSAAVNDAIRTAEWWGLVESVNGLGEKDVSITDAGRVWVESEFARLGRPKEGSPVKERGRRQPSFSIGTNYGVINVGHNIKGNKTEIHTTGPNEYELLSALVAVLERRDIPWESPRLAGVRTEIEDAISERDAHRSGLKSALSKLLQVCKDLAIGLSGDAIFEVLKSYVTR